VFRTIILKTFHKALDVMFATAGYRIGCKGFVACSRKNSDEFEFIVSGKVLSAGPLYWRETRLCEAKTDRE
jgi:hypothetical protein